MSSTVKAVISMYRRGEENRSKDTKRAFQSLKTVQNKVSTIFKKHLAYFLGLKEIACKLGLGSFDPKLYRLVKGNSKTEITAF